MNNTGYSSIRISCIIPTLGRGQVLCDTIEMLLTQTFPAHEIIVVDQTLVPEEETRRFLAEGHQQGRIRWLRQKEPNASKARNDGALAASGDIVLLLDDDIRVKPDFLAAYAETFKRTSAAGVAGQVLDRGGETVDVLPAKAFDPEIGWFYFRKNYSKACETTYMISCNVAIRRDIFLNLGGMDENYERGAHREETDFAMRFIRAGYKFQFNPLCSIYHLGPSGVAGGGARNWHKGKDFRYFHHCVGDWYFLIGQCKLKHLPVLLFKGSRYFVLNQQSKKNLLRVLPAFLYWLSAAPVALWRRMCGAKLIRLPHR